MGSILISRETAIDLFTEIVGYKAGISLTPEELSGLVAKFDKTLAVSLVSDTTPGFRFHSTEIDEIAAQLLYHVGNIESPSTIPPHIELYHRVKKVPEKLACYEHVMNCYVAFMREVMSNPPPAGTALDPEAFMRASMYGFGELGLEMAMEVIKGINHQMHVSPYGRVRLVDWNDTAELESLFKSESLETMYGSFFDQRFIDYLNQNFGEIGNIHWRKFEGLAGEYFDREGFTVDIGPGRNDDGIDLRIHPKEVKEDVPPLIIVQCKRQKEKIGKTLLKSVYADVLHEKAESGLIVTSSFISPGTETMRQAREYPVETADRDTLRDWISGMTTPKN